MKMIKESFLKTEFGSELEANMRALNYYLNEIRRTSQFLDIKKYQELDDDIQSLYSKWHVYQLAMKQFYGIEYRFIRADEYYGICTSDGDFLFKNPHEN